MNSKERLHLEKMIKDNNIEETTGKIRELKHSSLIKADIENYLFLKKKYPRLLETNREQFKRMAEKKCNFIFIRYRNLYDRLIKNELNLNIVELLLKVLKRIEEGEIDQHEGSYEVGKILKELYVDSALRRDTKREKKKKKKAKKRVMNITWTDFKRLKLNKN